MRTSGSVQTVPVPYVVVVYLYKTIRTPPKYSRRLCLGDEVTNPDMGAQWGVVVDPISLCEEIAELKSQGVQISKQNLLISEAAHLVFPYHKLIDQYREREHGPNKIGTTKRGIGPAYGDKIARVGIRLGDLLDPKLFNERLEIRRQEVDWLLQQYGAKPLDWRELNRQYLAAGEQLREMVTNTVLELHRLMEQGKEMLFEGAQGTFLDIDHGTYPYVTSSNTTAGGACTGSGVPPNRIDRVVGAVKAYTTRVGEGRMGTALRMSC